MSPLESTVQQLRDDLNTYAAIVAEAKPSKPNSILRALAHAAKTYATRIDQTFARLLALSPDNGADLSQPRVLVVDDLVSVQMMTAATLAPIGIRVDVAASSSEALSAIAGNGYHAVLLDMHLGPKSELNGLKMLAAIVELTRHLPVPPVLIGMSIDSTPAVMEQARLNGAADWIQKPIDSARLIRQVCGALWKEHRSIKDDQDSILDPITHLALLAFATPERQHEIVRHALSDALESLSGIRNSSHAGDLPAWREHMTALHGIAAQLGARELSRLIDTALSGALDRQAIPETPSSSQLESELERARLALRVNLDT